jgi:hypothetical protein
VAYTERSGRWPVVRLLPVLLYTVSRCGVLLSALLLGAALGFVFDSFLFSLVCRAVPGTSDRAELRRPALVSLVRACRRKDVRPGLQVQFLYISDISPCNC